MRASTLSQWKKGISPVPAFPVATAADKLTIARGSDLSVEVSGAGRHYRSLLPSTLEDALMHEELGILGPDPVYERALSA